VNASIPSVVVDDFEARVADTGGLRLILRGTADSGAKASLDSIIAGVHDRAVDEKLAMVDVDLRLLEFMNSTCLKSLVTWLNNLREKTSAYRIRFISRADVYWQRRSLDALRAFAPDHVLVEATA
jgi:hypothetical protein